MNDSFHMRLYALTRIACIAWLVKSVSSNLKDCTLATTPSVILIVCIAVSVPDTDSSAVQLWITQGKSHDGK